MKQRIALIIFSGLLLACGSESKISEDLDCKPESYSNLETIEDFKNLYSVQYPDNWKTNLYYDFKQSSIFTADTTKQLTETMLFDITHVSNKLVLNDDFIMKFKSSLVAEQLVEAASYKFQFNDKEAYFSRAIGKKRGFDYQVLNIFIKINPENYMNAIIRVYGDSLVNQRLCNGISLLEKIEF